MNEPSPVLEVQNISKSFSGVPALKDLNLRIYPGEVTAITGENGAGKSTLMKIIAGVYRDYEGSILLNGQGMHFTGPKDAALHGVSIIHQELNLIPGLTIAENIFLGREPVKPTGILDYKKMNSEASELLNMLHLQTDPETPVSRLSVGQQQLVEIARALGTDSKVLIMDEPTSAISDKEVDLLFSIIRKLTAKGVAVLYISHRMKEIFEISDRYAVLRDGELAGTGITSDSTRDQLISMMVGRKFVESMKQEYHSPGKELLRVEDFCMNDPGNSQKLRVDSVNFTLHEGEVLGISGLLGSGRSELLESLFGLYCGLVSGKIYVHGSVVKIESVNDAIRAGMALVPEDRKLRGLILNMSVVKNTSLSSLDKISPYGFISKKSEEKLSREFIEKLNIRLSDHNMEVEKLSGGNQQKVVIAKWLATNPKILLLDEPTRGIDVGAKAEIYSLISRLAGEGMGIIVVSSELTEILAISDRILVMAESRQSALLSRDEADEETIMKAALIQNTGKP